MDSIYDLRKNSRGTGKNPRMGNFKCMAQTMLTQYEFDTRFNEDDREAFKEVHAEKMRVLKDTKLRAYRTGISSTRIRNMQHKGCPNGQSKCKLCRKKIKTDTTKKHQAFTDTAIVCD